MSNAENLKKKKDSGKPYSKQEKDLPFVEELERLAGLPGCWLAPMKRTLHSYMCYRNVLLTGVN